jgi:nucleotide-binding universal stress UspA family protein
MRIVLGIDSAGRWRSAADLLIRLHFREGVVDTLHVDEPPVYFLGTPVEGLAKLAAEGTNPEGQRRAEEASALLREQGLITGACTVASGSAAAGLLRYADQVKAQLIAVGNSGKSPMRAFFTGSVGRGLVIGAHQSILIARTASLGSREPVRAVLATDHSAYSNRCIDRLLRLAPQGISHLTVLTVYPKDRMEALRPFLPDFVLDPASWIEEGLEKRNQEVMDRLASLGCVLESRVASGDVHQSIHEVMAEADLLILGAQGHGFTDRLTLGSVSFHEALAQSHSILLLRTEDDPAFPTREEDI